MQTKPYPPAERAGSPRHSPACSPSSLYHQKHFVFDSKRSDVWHSLCRYLQRFVKPDSGFLEIGAGYGDLIRFIQAKEKWALDIEPSLAGRWPPEVRPLIQSALSPLPLPDESIGTVAVSNLLEHFTMEEGRAVLLEIHRVLMRGGRLIAIQPNFRLAPERYFDDYTHKTPYTDAGFAGFLSSLGWSIAHVEPRFLPFSMKSRLPKSGLLVSVYLTLPLRPFAGQFLVIAEKR